MKLTTYLRRKQLVSKPMRKMLAVALHGPVRNAMQQLLWELHFNALRDATFAKNTEEHQRARGRAELAEALANALDRIEKEEHSR